ncbi:MAG: serine acetyltransferase [Trebouxia sp. A1-2]|nr:MAG: serine acetyltransferase [Trebouxia sp. A1-2]
MLQLRHSVVPSSPHEGRSAAGPAGPSHVCAQVVVRANRSQRTQAVAVRESSASSRQSLVDTASSNALVGLDWAKQRSGSWQGEDSSHDSLTGQHLAGLRAINAHQAQLWSDIRTEAKLDAETEPLLASFLHTNILAHPSLGKALSHLLASKMQSRTLLGTQLMRLIFDAYQDDSSILEAGMADMEAAKERDPACDKYTQCILYFKGFQAIQCQRIAHWLWKKDRKMLAVALQSRVSEVLHVDIHPAAQLGSGVLIDHATGVVIGETAVVGNNVSMLHHVTLGGSGTGKGIRHPTIGDGALLGAGVSVLGPIKVGAGCKVGAGSVVVKELPDYCVAVGVPARIIKQLQVKREPSIDMDQCDDFILDYVI